MCFRGCNLITSWILNELHSKQGWDPLPLSRDVRTNTLSTLSWTGAGRDTHRPGELEGDHYLARLVRSAGAALGAVKRKRISTENLRRSTAERAGAGGDHLRLVLLEAHFEVSVALVSSAAQILGVPGAVAALPVRQLAVLVLHGDQLQLEIAGWLGHLGEQHGQNNTNTHTHTRALH